MKLHELKPATRSEKAPKRVSRGIGSSLDRDTGKGEEGQNARSDGGVRPGFEGGQMPLCRKLPRRGFTSISTKQCISINVDRLNIFENGTEIAPKVLLERGVISKVKDGVKILGNGTLEKNLTVKGHKFSKPAAKEIGAAGRKVGVI